MKKYISVLKCIIVNVVKYTLQNLFVKNILNVIYVIFIKIMLNNSLKNKRTTKNS